MVLLAKQFWLGFINNPYSSVACSEHSLVRLLHTHSLIRYKISLHKNSWVSSIVVGCCCRNFFGVWLALHRWHLFNVIRTMCAFVWICVWIWIYIFPYEKGDTTANRFASNISLFGPLMQYSSDAISLARSLSFFLIQVVLSFGRFLQCDRCSHSNKCL